MNRIKIYTIGVYGTTKESFFNSLTKNSIDTFCDIRRRRAVRGSEYTYVNSKRLQDNLSELNINYLHFLDLSPTDDIRKLQNKFDSDHNLSQRKREELSPEFISRYKKEILNKFEFDGFMHQLKSIGSKNVVLFCVEKKATACHRSLASEYLHKKYGFLVKHL